MHPGGFEPPTARFVAEYSIQLSYGCIGKIYFTADIDTATKAISSKRWCIREDYSPCGSPFGPLLKQRYPPWCLRLYRHLFDTFIAEDYGEYGASGRIRTSDRSVRSRVLYPAELRMQMAVRRGFEPRMQLLTAYSLSRGAPSASRPPHHTPLTSASKNLFIAHRRCVAHILLSETYKSNNFSYTFIVCTLHVQLVCKNVKKSVLSTEKWRSDR